MAATKLGFRVSRSIARTIRPPIPRAYEWAEAFTATPSRPLLDMSQGVPGTPPPKLLLDAMGAAASAPNTCGYVPLAGEPSLRAAAALEIKHVYGQEADVIPEDIFITAGCNLAFVTAAIVLADAGDEIILPVPWYFNHEMTFSMLGINAVHLQTHQNDGFLPSPERAASLITPKTKAIVLVTPNNPTGAVYPPDLIAKFASLAHHHKIALIIDETYRDFVSPKPPHTLFSPPRSTSPSSLLPADWSWRSTFIHLFSFSKSYCIPGHRVGLICASSELAPQIAKALDTLQICAPRSPQLGLAGNMVALRPFVRSSTEALAHRHALFQTCLPKPWKIGSQGGYFAFVQHPFAGVRAEEVCKRLASEIGVLTLPATFFMPLEQSEGQVEMERWIRFSVANVDDDTVKLVCGRLRECEGSFGWNVSL